MFQLGAFLQSDVNIVLSGLYFNPKAILVLNIMSVVEKSVNLAFPDGKRDGEKNSDND